METSAAHPFLDAELAARFAAGAIDLLRTSCSPEQVLDLARTACWYAEHCLARLEMAQPLPQPIACEAGCDACCYNQVEVTPPEALLLGSFLTVRTTPAVRQELRQRAETYLQRRAGLGKEEAARQRRLLPCPLLVEHRCLGYEARPLMCRAMHSLDPAACQRELDDPLRPQVPFYSHRQIIYVSLSHGLVQVCRVFGWQAGPVDLAQAVLVILDQPEVVIPWLAGQPVFG